MSVINASSATSTEAPEPACRSCDGAATTYVCKQCGRLFDTFLNAYQNSILISLLAVQLKQAKQATLLNNAMSNIIEKMTTQAERDVKATQILEETATQCANFDANVAHLLEQIEALKATVAAEKKCGAKEEENNK